MSKTAILRPWNRPREVPGNFKFIVNHFVMILQSTLDKCYTYKR